MCDGDKWTREEGGLENWTWTTVNTFNLIIHCEGENEILCRW